MKFQKLLIPLLAIFASCSQPPSNLKTNNIFGDHMVLQRNIPVKIWGKATPKTTVTVNIAQQSISATANSDSVWIVTLQPLEAGGPFDLTVSTFDSEEIFTDVLIGEVWVCSGQSNMQFELQRSNNGKKELANMNYDQIRFVKIAKDIELKPLTEFRTKPKWGIANTDSVADFSAVAFYFGRKIHEELNVPVGLIGSNWGGTIVEAWTSEKSLNNFKEFEDRLNFIANTKYTVPELKIIVDSIFNDFKENIFPNGIGIDKKWYLPETDISDWKNIKVPSFWEDAIPELSEFDGVVWYRTTFDIPKEYSGKDLVFWFGKTNDHDAAWINGESLGAKYHKTTWTNYEASASILKPTNNVLVMKIYNTHNKGGFSGIAEHFDCKVKGENATVVLNTAGNWIYKTGDVLKKPLPDFIQTSKIDPNTYPTGLYNAMIHPLINYGVKGAIWYQGESNEDRAHQYQYLFPALINDWRANWGQEVFDFYFVQLANFKAQNEQPSEGTFAELREAQTMALSLPNTGMATIIDIGEADDIHPTNKKDVGERLALNALHTSYGKDIVYCGPMYQSHEIKDNKITIHYSSTGGGLITKDGKAPVGFAVAGEDEKYYWANATIEGETIVLTCKNVNKPLYIRYAWADNPATNLYNKEDLPAVPFRTDTFKCSTFGKK